MAGRRWPQARARARWGRTARPAGGRAVAARPTAARPRIRQAQQARGGSGSDCSATQNNSSEQSACGWRPAVWAAGILHRAAARPQPKRPQAGEPSERSASLPCSQPSAHPRSNLLLCPSPARAAAGRRISHWASSTPSGRERPAMGWVCRSPARFGCLAETPAGAHSARFRDQATLKAPAATAARQRCVGGARLQSTTFSGPLVPIQPPAPNS